VTVDADDLATLDLGTDDVEPAPSGDELRDIGRLPAAVMVELEHEKLVLSAVDAGPRGELLENEGTCGGASPPRRRA
jgi:hypothetical protein